MKSTFLSALLYAATVLAAGPPTSMAEKFTGLNVLDEAYMGASFGLNQIASSSYTKSKWAWGTLPKHCYDTAVNNGYCNPYDVEVYDITYSDCTGTKNVMCRCNNAQMTIDQVATSFGKVPVKARQWIRYVSAYPASSCSAWNGGNNIALFGNCPAATVYFHETAHSLDGWAIPPGTGSAYSYTAEWAGITAMGTCVPDNYAKASWAEHWAQVAVMSAYHANVRSIWDLNVGCMADQMGKSIEQLVTNPIVKRVSGATCNRSWSKDPTVCMGPAARDSGNCPGLLRRDDETVAAEAAGIEIVDQPELPAEIAAKVKADEDARRKHAEKEAGVVKLNLTEFKGKTEKRFVA